MTSAPVTRTVMEMISTTLFEEHFFNERPFNGMNSHSVLIMDKCPVHNIVDANDL